MSAETPTREKLEQLRQTRRADLIRTFVGGTKLTEQEMAEIADLIPPALLVNPPVSRTGFRRGYEFYAAEIGYEVRNIKRWVAAGKAAGRLPPLDDPAGLVDWWEELRGSGHLKQSCPARVKQYATKAVTPAAAAASSVPAAAPSTAPGAAGATGAKIRVQDLEAIGLSAAVAELSRQLAADQQLLREGRESGLSESIVERRAKAFNTTLESLRSTEVSYQKLQEARGELAPVESFRSDLTTLMTTLRGMIRLRERNVRARLADKLTAEQLAWVGEALTAEADREIIQMRSAKHWKRNPDGSIVE